MKLLRRDDGRIWRALEPDEKIRDGDYLTSPQVKGWHYCNASVMDTLSSPKQRMDWTGTTGLVFWREVDPLIVQMLRVRKRRKK